MSLYGLYHLVNQLVSVCIAGVDCGDFRVASDGSVTVPFGSDAGGLVTPLFLLMMDGSGYGDAAVPIKITFDDATVQTVTVSAVIGYTYTTQGQVLRPLAQAETLSQTGPALGLTRRTHMISALLNNTMGISFGTTFSSLLPANFTEADGQTPLNGAAMFNGVYWNVVEDDYSFDSQLAWQISRPVPATVVSVGQFLETQERS